MREAIIEAGRPDLIGRCDGLIPANPPTEAIEARWKPTDTAATATYSRTVSDPAKGKWGAGPARSTGYRPGRKTQVRRQGKKGP